MKLRPFSRLLVLLLLVSPLFAADTKNPKLDARDLLATMERVADWQLAHPSAHATTDWTQAAGDAGILALAEISGNPKYREALVAIGTANGWQPGKRFYHADDLAIGQTYAGLYRMYRHPKMIAPLRERLNGILAKQSEVTSLDFTQPYDRATEQWSWCDSLFMAPPVWMQMYSLTGDERYLDFALKNWWRTTEYLYDPAEHLYYRDSTYFNKREANGKKVFWSRGNGWVLAGLVRVLQVLPQQHPHRTRFEQLYRDMANAVLAAQQPDGFWHASLLDPASYPMKETSGTGFYAYALAWGVNQGLLDRQKFEPAVLHAWEALRSCVNADGKLTHVQPIGSDPKAFPEDSTEVYGVGAFLLAGSEIYRMAVLAETRSVDVQVSNAAEFARQGETVEVRLPLAKLHTQKLAVMDGSSARILDSQIYAQHGSTPDTLLFQVDVAPGESRAYRIVDAALLPATPQPIVRTYARQMEERYRDFAWESDRIAHRIYHRDLIAGEGTESSGVDVWVKRTRNLVLENWYKRGDYHNDHGEGLDDYRVGRSRGCGGIGVWSRGKLFVSSNYTSARLITTGPIRSEFEVTYDAGSVGDGTVRETRRLSIDAGSNMTRATSTLTSSSSRSLLLAVGIAEREGNGISTRKPAEGWVGYWQPVDRDRGSIACALVLPKIQSTETQDLNVPAEERSKASNEGLPPVRNILALTPVHSGEPFTFYFGAGWSLSGDFASDADWAQYVAAFRARLQSPLRVSISR